MDLPKTVQERALELNLIITSTEAESALAAAVTHLPIGKPCQIAWLAVALVRERARRKT